MLNLSVSPTCQLYHPKRFEQLFDAFVQRMTSLKSMRFDLVVRRGIIASIGVSANLCAMDAQVRDMLRYSYNNNTGTGLSGSGDKSDYRAQSLGSRVPTDVARGRNLDTLLRQLPTRAVQN